ncbi:hypothetical protein BG003_002870 [Podila horticola]|nr:hypothetical protein BG003_002870 [Podila horticola]
MSVKDPRLSQILPVIRCSDCGHDVEFRLLGEHICSSAPAMPALPVLPLSKHTPSSGGYRPGYKPPPIPISSSPTPQAPVSPGRPSTASSRPALPFLEKYAKKNKSGASASPPAPSATPPSQYSNNNNITGSPLSISPTTPTGPSYGQQLSNGMNGHYQREQNDYFPKTPVDDRFGQQASSQYQAQRSKTPVDDPSRRYQTSPAPIPGSGSRSKTPNQDSSSQFSTSPTSSRASQPALPQKSNARSPSIASAHGLGINGLDMNGHKSPSGYDQPEYSRERERERDYRGNEYDTSPPSIANGFNRSGSSGSAASGIMAERGHQRERSNTAQSERSERSIRSGRSEKERSERSDRSRYPDEDPRRDRDRSDRGDRERERERERERDGRGQLTPSSSRSNGRHPDPSSAYKTPSPPISPEDLRPAETIGGKSSPYRPPTPPDMSSPVPSRGRRPSVPAPARKASGDQFDALMDDLIQEINVLPTSGRDSTRPASAHRSRSRPNIPEFGINGGSSASLRSGSPPPTPGLPKLASGSDSIRSHRSGRERSERSERSERDRGDREHRDRSDRDRERERGDRDRERAAGVGERSERDRERSDRDRERSHRSDRERAERSSATSRTRSRSTNRRGGVQHCEGCKHDIQPQEAGDVIKMAHGDYHPECFKCARCRRPIESARQGHEYEGRLLCEKDYQRMLEKEAQRSGQPSSTSGRERSERSERSRNANCAGCDGPIQKGETPVYALGQSWHEHHLSCYQCKKPIQQSVGHVEKNGRIYCPRDFGELFLPKCRGCGLPVEKEAVCAQDGKLEGKWHAACFGCQTCKKPFPDKSFYVYGDAPYCRRHYHKLNNSLCKSCDQPIEGPCAQTMEGWRFHPGCFSCVECRTPLTDIYYNFENQAYCEKDIMVIQRTRNVRAERRKTFFGKV